jgi:hypothetical protein
MLNSAFHRVDPWSKIRDVAEELSVASHREGVEATIEKLIALLDQIDGDPDFEDGADREEDHAERGLADQDALDSFIADGGIIDNLCYDGSGREMALKMLRRADHQMEGRA